MVHISVAEKDVISSILIKLYETCSPAANKHHRLQQACQRAPNPLCFATRSFDPFFLGLSAGRRLARAATSSSNADVAGAAPLPLALGAHAPAPQATHCCAIHLVSCASSAWCSVLRAHHYLGNRHLVATQVYVAL